MVNDNYKERKRSKRHRIKRNNISNKERYHSTMEFSAYARDVERKYRARYQKPLSIATLTTIKPTPDE